MTKDEFIQEFKENIVHSVYYNMPKDYRQSNEYQERSFDAKFRDACCHSSFESVLEDEIGSLYDKIKEYEDIRGY